jgi:methylated-DNA-protein-cysteine methyltransferase-like protein
MARTDEAEAFYHAVYAAVQEVPEGKVTSYGHIAKLIGTRECMHFCSSSLPCSPSMLYDSKDLHFLARCPDHHGSMPPYFG